MPLYEYRCDACGHHFEKIQKFSDPPVDVCPNCGEPRVQKLLSSPAIQFKGSGWYITDYARKGDGGTDAGGKTGSPETKPAAADSKSTSSESGSSTKSSDSTGAPSTTPSNKPS